MIRKHIALTLVVGVGVGFMIWKSLPAGWTPMRTAGLCLLVAGFVLWTVARFQLGSSFAVTAQARQLVTRGLYSKIRNPIYIFGSCVIAGAILLLGRLVGASDLAADFCAHRPFATVARAKGIAGVGGEVW